MVEAFEVECSIIIELKPGIGRDVDDWQRVGPLREGEAVLVLLQPYGLRIKLPLRVANGCGLSREKRAGHVGLKGVYGCIHEIQNRRPVSASLSRSKPNQQVGS
jgi:hypothetical protein